MEFRNIKIIVSEIDGVLTDGKNALDHMNRVIFKTYCDMDFEAINELKSFFTFVFLSSYSEMNYSIMRLRNIPAYFTSNKDDKLTILTKKILPRYNTRPENLLYIGSRMTDIPCLHLAEVGLAVKNSSSRVIQAANEVIPFDSGQGVISYVDDVLRSEKNKR